MANLVMDRHAVLYSLYAQNPKRPVDSYIFELFQLTGIQVSSGFRSKGSYEIKHRRPQKQSTPGEPRTTTSVPTIHWVPRWIIAS